MEKDATIASTLTLTRDNGSRREFNMQLHIRERLFRLDRTRAIFHRDDTVCERPVGLLFAIYRMPCIKVTAIEQDNGIRGRDAIRHATDLCRGW